MFDQWQQPLDIPALIRKGITFQGEARVSEMLSIKDGLAARASGRLDGVVLNDPLVRFEFRFSRNEVGHRLIEGSVDTVVELVCQRCLEPVVVEIHAEIMLGVLNNEQDVGKLPESTEPLVLGESPVWLADLIEDEILLALPVVPRHAHLCVPFHREYNDTDVVENPFAALRGLVKPAAH
jgi:uncharacterized protein